MTTFITFFRWNISCVTVLTEGRSDKALGAIADQILTPGDLQGLSDEVGVLGARVLEQSPLQLLLVIVGRDVHVLARHGVYTCIIHYGGDSSRCRIEVLDLLGRVAPLLQPKRHINSILHRRARMAGHKVRYKILLKPRLVAEPEELALEFLEDLDRRLSHHRKSIESAMLGRYLELARGVVRHKLAEERIVLVENEIVKSDSRAHEHLLYAFYLLDLA